MQTKPPKRCIIYRGPSLLDGSPIVAVYLQGSNNRKTGNLSQTYIIREDMSPIEANRTGADYALCGNCKHRGTAAPSKASGFANKRSCYVNLGQGPGQVYKALSRNTYPEALDLETIQSIGEGQAIRLGTYGDPQAVPVQVWRALTSKARTWTGYTHQGNKGADSALYMQSTDSLEQAQEMHDQGLRTFRVIPITQANAPLLPNEIECPSTKGITCIECKLCKGQGIKGKSIAIMAHSPGGKHA